MLLLAGGSRISHHLRLGDCDHHLHLGFCRGFCSSTVVHLPCPWPLYFRSPSVSPHCPFRLRRSTPSSCSILFSKSHEEIPPLSDSFSRQEADYERPSQGLSSVTGGIVALGKFDALHIGHRELAVQASKVGVPFLLSFVGMAEVFGWEPRAPIVAKCDRMRVLSSWAPYCGNIAPSEFEIEFSSVRHLTPLQFVEKLSKELGVRGVVAGENYRFGYKAAGDASDLARLCEECGIGAYIIKSVMDKNQSKFINSSDSKERGQVSSTRVRRAFSVGDMKYVSELLGRRHRLVLMLKAGEGFYRSKRRLSALKSSLLNLAPKEGLYDKCLLCMDAENLIPCRVVIDMTHIHIEIDATNTCNIDSLGTSDLHLLHIEFVT